MNKLNFVIKFLVIGVLTISTKEGLAQNQPLLSIECFSGLVDQKNCGNCGRGYNVKRFYAKGIKIKNNQNQKEFFVYDPVIASSDGYQIKLQGGFDINGNRPSFEFNKFATGLTWPQIDSLIKSCQFAGQTSGTIDTTDKFTVDLQIQDSVVCVTMNDQVIHCDTIRSDIFEGLNISVTEQDSFLANSDQPIYQYSNQRNILLDSLTSLQLRTTSYLDPTSGKEKTIMFLPGGKIAIDSSDIEIFESTVSSVVDLVVASKDRMKMIIDSDASSNFTGKGANGFVVAEGGRDINTATDLFMVGEDGRIYLLIYPDSSFTGTPWMDLALNSEAQIILKEVNNNYVNTCFDTIGVAGKNIGDLVSLNMNGFSVVSSYDDPTYGIVVDTFSGKALVMSCGRVSITKNLSLAAQTYWNAQDTGTYFRNNNVLSLIPGDTISPVINHKGGYINIPTFFSFNLGESYNRNLANADSLQQENEENKYILDSGQRLIFQNSFQSLTFGDNILNGLASRGAYFDLVADDPNANIGFGSYRTTGGQYVHFFGEVSTGGTFGMFYTGRNPSFIGESTIGFAAPNVNITGRLNVNDRITLSPITATEASALSATNGDLIYVSSTDGTFTSIGFWGYENGIWTKL